MEAAAEEAAAEVFPVADKIIYDGNQLRHEGNNLIYSSNPAACVCCGGGSESSPSVSDSDSLSESSVSESFDGDCCVYVTGLAHCNLADSGGDEDDPIGAWLCTQCHPGVPTSFSGDPTNDGRNVWYSSSYDYDLSSGDWHVEQKACPIWYNAFTGVTYWPPIPIAPTISTTTAANAVLTSYTATHDCTTSDDGGGCYNATGCTSITIRFEGTSTPPTCTNCPACGGYSTADSWSFQGYDTPHTGWSSGDPVCNSNPYAPGEFRFYIRSGCGQVESNKLIGEACDSCP